MLHAGRIRENTITGSNHGHTIYLDVDVTRVEYRGIVGVTCQLPRDHFTMSAIVKLRFLSRIFLMYLHNYTHAQHKMHKRLSSSYYPPSRRGRIVELPLVNGCCGAVAARAARQQDPSPMPRTMYTPTDDHKRKALPDLRASRDSWLRLACKSRDADTSPNRSPRAVEFTPAPACATADATPCALLPPACPGSVLNPLAARAPTPSLLSPIVSPEGGVPAAPTRGRGGVRGGVAPGDDC